MSIKRFSRAILGLALVAGAAGATGCNDDPNETMVATTVSISSGNQQVAVLGAALASPIVVKVVDQDGDDFPGATVTWAVVDGGGTVSAVTSTTDSNGNAQVNWTLGGLVAGTNSVTATVAGLTPVTFTATSTIQ